VRLMKARRGHAGRNQPLSEEFGPVSPTMGRDKKALLFPPVCWGGGVFSIFSFFFSVGFLCDG